MIITFIFILLIGLITFGIKLMESDDSYWGWASGLIIIAISILTLLIIAISLIITYSTVNSTIAQYNSIKNTIEVERNQNDTELERAALTKKIISVNEDVAFWRYWNNTWIGSEFVPDKLAELNYLK